MDDLLGLLITIVLVGFAFSNKKKKKTRGKKHAEKPSASPAKQPRIPYTKEEWAAFLKEQARENPKTSINKEKKPAAKPALKPDPVLYLEHDEPEGTVSTQGESAAEHAQHRLKVLAEEEARREQQETLQELRRMNTRKLRSAVVMSEVLGKPVSLRPRGYR